MTRPQLNPEISWGHILTIISLLIAGAGGFFGLQVRDAELQAQIEANTEATKRNIARIEELDAWRYDHTREWDKHVGAYGVENK
jgi:hypothetical protein